MNEYLGKTLKVVFVAQVKNYETFALRDCPCQLPQSQFPPLQLVPLMLMCLIVFDVDVFVHITSQQFCLLLVQPHREGPL